MPRANASCRPNALADYATTRLSSIHRAATSRAIHRSAQMPGPHGRDLLSVGVDCRDKEATMRSVEATSLGSRAGMRSVRSWMGPGAVRETGTECEFLVILPT